jgi:RNA polymerase sigma-70 factor, ECF subfamily
VSGVQAEWDWETARRLCLKVAHRYAHGSDAEDIAQEALIRAWRHRASLRAGQRLGPWLATIARNEALRHRSRRRPEPIADVSGGSADDAALLGLAERVDLESTLGTLADQDQLLLRLRYVDDMTQPAIASLLDLPEGTVKVRLHRARLKLREALRG